MAKFLKYSVKAARESGVTSHPLMHLKALDVSYRKAVPLSEPKEWQIWLPEGDLDNLPTYIEVVDGNPFKYIGGEFTYQDALKLASEEEFIEYSENVVLTIGGVECKLSEVTINKEGN